jgi:hypothetical protein
LLRGKRLPLQRFHAPAAWRRFDFRALSRCCCHLKNWLIVATESGIVDVYDISNPAAIRPDMPQAASLNVRTATVFTGL